jgi:hypothetical protein
MFKLHSLGLGLLAAGSLVACSVNRDAATTTAGYYFVGHVYDGVTNERLTDYKLKLSYARDSVKADVDDDGLFYVGPLPPFHDYTVTISADGYRAFYASEPMMPVAVRAPDEVQSQIFEAYLFPDGLEAPALSFSIRTPDGTAPSGTLRVTPAGDDGTSGLALDGRVDGSVAGQVWDNDADRKSRTIVKEVSDGSVGFDQGELVYGVTYTATLYAAEGYQFKAFEFTAGLTDDTDVVLPRLDEQPLALVSNSLDTENLNDHAEVVLRFNRNIVLSPTEEEGLVLERLDDGFSIVSPDLDGDGDVNELTLTDEDNARERGTELSIDGDTLTLKWARKSSNFETTDKDDPILAAIYDIQGIVLRPDGGRADEEARLSDLIGSTDITVLVDPDRL